MKVTLIPFLFLFILNSCKKNTNESASNYPTYYGTGIIKGFNMAGCNLHIKMIKGFDAITANYSPSRIFFNDSSIMSTPHDSLFIAMQYNNYKLNYNDTINITFNFDFRNVNSTVCAANGMEIFPNSVFVIEFTK